MQTTDFQIVNEAGGLVCTAGDIVTARRVARREAQRLGCRLRVRVVKTTVEVENVYLTPPVLVQQERIAA